MNLAAMRTAVDYRTGRAMDATALASYINEAHHAIETETDWPWLEQVATLSALADTASYTAPSDWIRTRELQIDSYEPLTYRSISSLDTAYPDSATRGLPRAYGIFAGSILLRPIPDGAYSVTHRYIRTEADLTLDADVPLMPVNFHMSIVEWATAIVHDRLGNRVEADAAWGRARDWLRRMADNNRKTSAPGGPRIRSGSCI